MELMFGQAPTTQQWLNVTVGGAWILGETCTASFQPWMPRLGVWLALPECKARNSWRWLCVRLRRNGPVYALRWTLPTWWPASREEAVR